MYLETPDTSLESVAAVAAFCLTLATAQPGDGNAASNAMTTRRLIEALHAKAGDLRHQGADQIEIRIMQRLSDAVEAAAALAMRTVTPPPPRPSVPFRFRRSLV